MRSFTMFFLLLAACGANTNTAPRVVKVFESAPSQKESLWSDDCSWEAVTLSVFNQDAQTITFETQNCQNEPTNLYVKNGNDVFVHVKVDHQDVNVLDEDMLILSIWKTGPLTDEDFIKSLIPKTEQAEALCQAVRSKDNSWRIGLNVAGQLDGFAGGWVMYPPLSSIVKYEDSTGICGPYGYNGGTMINIGISDGIAIGYNEMFRMVGYFDLNSITYENKS